MTPTEAALDAARAEEREMIVEWLIDMESKSRPFGLALGDWPHSAIQAIAEGISLSAHREPKP